MAVAAVADTRAALWHFYDDPRLSSRAASFIAQQTAAGNQIVISAITLVEMVYLQERGRIPADALTRLVAAIDQPG